MKNRILLLILAIHTIACAPTGYVYERDERLTEALAHLEEMGLPSYSVTSIVIKETKNTKASAECSRLSDGSTQIRIGSKYFEEATYSVLLGILAHEIGHCVFGDMGHEAPVYLMSSSFRGLERRYQHNSNQIYSDLLELVRYYGK